MAVTGPIPHRSDQRVRRNLYEPVDKVTAIGKVKIPDLGISDCHPLVTAIYGSLKNSAQRKWMEPSDWEYARLTLFFLNQQLWAGRPSAQMLATLGTMLSNLLMTEGDRRRVRIEVDRVAPGKEATVTPISDVYRQRLGQA